jgi:hypothetical protein
VPAAVFEGLFASSLEQIYTARDSYSEDARHAHNLMLATVAGVAFLLLAPFQFEIGNDPMGRTTCWILVAFGGFVAILYGQYLRENLDSGYDLYLASIIHAYVVAEAVGHKCPPTYGWLPFRMARARSLASVPRVEFAFATEQFPLLRNQKIPILAKLSGIFGRLIRMQG